MVGLVVEQSGRSRSSGRVQHFPTTALGGWPVPGGVRGRPLNRGSSWRVLTNRTDERRIEAIAAPRRLRFSGPEIAELPEMPLSTVSGILTRIGMVRLGRLGPEPAQRYERARPGELSHIDAKRLGRIVGGGAGHRVTGRAGRGRYAAGSFTDAAATQPTGWEFVMSPSTTPPGVPTPSPDRRDGPRSGRVPARAGLLRQLRDHRRAADRPAYAIHAIACRALAVRYLPARPRRTQTKTGRQEASSARYSAAGPTARSTAPAEYAPQP